VHQSSGHERRVWRAFEVSFSCSALLLLIPLLLIIGIVLYSTSQRPIFYGHWRVGRNGRAFRCWKFRTMVPDAETRLQAILATNPKAAREWNEYGKLRDDPRVTSFGHFLRVSSLDELPQLFNVLRGEMTLIGPRPITADELTRYGASAQIYLDAKPGLTGPWQISGRSSLTFEERVNLDCAYLQSRTLMGDIIILCRTPAALLRHYDAA
jgi:exopolysaccharide production protein ExoY